MNERPPKSKKAPAGRRARGLLSVAVDVGKILKPLSHKKDFAAFDLARAWSGIMGADLSNQCVPQRLTRGPEGRDGTLHLGVWGPLALELQHMTPQLIERVNAHYGYRAVAKVVFHQTPPQSLTVEKKVTDRKPADASRPGDAAAIADIEDRAAAVEDPELRAALLALGRSVHGKREKPGNADAEDQVQD